MTKEAKCQLCGEAMPAGEEMFNYHGYSGPCPKPFLAASGSSSTVRHSDREAAHQPTDPSAVVPAAAPTGRGGSALAAEDRAWLDEGIASAWNVGTPNGQRLALRLTRIRAACAAPSEQIEVRRCANCGMLDTKGSHGMNSECLTKPGSWFRADAAPGSQRETDGGSK